MNWWLKLYTIPCLKTSILIMTAGSILNAIFSMFAGFSIPALYLLFGYFFGLLYITRDDSFRVNMEFHKMSIPYRDLQRAFFLHSLIVYFFILCSFCFFHFISSVFGLIPSENLVLSPVVVIASIFCGFFAWLFSQLHSTPDKRYVLLTKNHSLIERILIVGQIYLFICLMFFILAFLHLSQFIFLPMLGLIIIFPMGWYGIRAMFHHIPEHLGVFRSLRLNLLSLGVVYSVYFTFAFLGQVDVSNVALSKAQRYQAFQAWYPLVEKLDRTTFMEFESLASGDLETLALYRKVDPVELKSVSAHYFIDNKKPERLYSFLAYSKDIHPTQLIYIFDFLTNFKTYWKDPKQEELFYKMAIYRWPANQRLPERHLAAQEKWNEMQLKRKMASEQKK